MHVYIGGLDPEGVLRMDMSFAAVTASVPPGLMLIGVGGDSGIGKTTLGTDLADELRVPCYDVGTVFRALTEVVRRRGLDPKDQDSCVALARECSFRLEGDMAVIARGHDESWIAPATLRSEWVNAHVSALTQNLEFWAAATCLARDWIDPTGPGVVIGRHMHAIFEMGLVLDVLRDPAESCELRRAQEGSAAAASLAERNRLDRETASVLNVQGPVERLDITGCTREEQLEWAIALVAKAGLIPA